MKNNQTYKNDFLNEENNYSMSQIFLKTLSIFVTLMTYVQDSISVTFQDIIFLSSYRGQRGLTFFHFHIFPFFKMSFNDIIQFILSKFLPIFIVENIKFHVSNTPYNLLLQIIGTKPLHETVLLSVVDCSEVLPSKVEDQRRQKKLISHF